MEKSLSRDLPTVFSDLDPDLRTVRKSSALSADAGTSTAIVRRIDRAHAGPCAPFLKHFRRIFVPIQTRLASYIPQRVLTALGPSAASNRKHVRMAAIYRVLNVASCFGVFTFADYDVFLGRGSGI